MAIWRRVGVYSAKPTTKNIENGYHDQPNKPTTFGMAFSPVTGPADSTIGEGDAYLMEVDPHTQEIGHYRIYDRRLALDRSATELREARAAGGKTAVAKEAEVARDIRILEERA